MHAFYRWAIDNEMTQVDPTVRVRRPKMRRVLPRPIEDRDLAYALDMANPELRAMLLLGCFQGLRCMEIAGLERQDIMDQAKPAKLRVAEGKGGHERVMPLHPAVLEALKAHRMPPQSRGGPIFTMEHGGGLTPRGCRLGCAYSSMSSTSTPVLTSCATTSELKFTPGAVTSD